MPFTFSHPAIVVPFKLLFKDRISVTGLALGAMVPDVEYFIRMKGRSEWSHSIDGVFWFDLPICILLSFLFHLYIRNPFVLHLPQALKGRLVPALSLEWVPYFKKRWPIIIFCILLGSASHLLWDHLTHETAEWLEKGINRDTIVPGEKDFVVYYIYFGINSIVGLLVLAWYTWQLPVYPLRIKTDPQSLYWTTALLVAIAVLFIRVIIGGDLPLLSYIDSTVTAILLGIVATTIREHRKSKVYR